MLELPAGKRDVQAEDPAVCMARELAEEIGREARSLTEIAHFYNSPGFSDEVTICYLAEDLVDCERMAQGVEERHLTIERVVLEDVDDLVASGELLDAKSIVGLAAARARLSGVKSQLSAPGRDS
jgi:ADP-ribose pyrophosphatase